MTDSDGQETSLRMIELNKHAIVKEMQASHILYYLPQLKENISDIIRKERNEGQTAANTLLLEKLLETREDHPGWYSSLITALEKAEFFKLANRLQRKDVKNDEVFKRLIACNLSALSSVQPSDIMPHLVSKGVLSNMDREEITRLEQTVSSPVAMLELVTKLPMHIDNWFPEFVISLRNRDCNEALMALEPMLSVAHSDDSIYRITNEIAQTADTETKKKFEAELTETKLKTETDHKQLYLNINRNDSSDTKGFDKIASLVNTAEKVGLKQTSQTGSQVARSDGSTATQVKQFADQDLSTDGGASLGLTSRCSELAGESVINLREDSVVQSSLCPQTSSSQQSTASNARLNLFDTTGAFTDTTEDNVLISDTVCVTGLNHSVSISDLEEHFGMIGEIKRDHKTKRPMVNVTADPQTGLKQAFITYDLPDCASFASEAFNGTEFQNVIIGVRIARQTARLFHTTRSPQTRAGSSKSPESSKQHYVERTPPQTLKTERKQYDESLPQTSPEMIIPNPMDTDLSALGACALDDKQPGDAETQQLQLRSYQKELAEKAMTGVNCLIVAPTGSGKTHVALAIVQNHFRRRGNQSKVVFFVPTVALVEQQRNMFHRYLSELETLGLSGLQDSKLPLMDILPSYNVLVMTPQIMENALNEDHHMSLGAFTLLIFDECHHTNKNHPYNAIMSHYIDELFDAEEKQVTHSLPQVVGLTASVGVGKSKSMSQAVEYILKLCANLDCREICTVNKHIGELMRHVNRPEEETKELKGRTNDPFYRIISEIMRKIESHMRDSPDAAILTVDQPNLLQAPRDHGTDRYTQWINGLEKPIARISLQNVRRFFVSCQRHLMVYNTALLINADCRTVDALSYIEKEFNPARVDQNELAQFADETDITLWDYFKEHKAELKRISNDPQYDNPKLDYLKDKIVGYYRENEDSRGIVFVKTREMTVALVNWMKETNELCDLNPHNLVGTNAPSQKAGQTAFKQEDVLKCFKDGQHKLIVATSVAEEGLDVQQCNWVIRYEHVTNSIARVQSRGRARAENAKYTLLAEQGRGAADKEMFNKIRETMMQRAISTIQNERRPQEIRQKIREYQRMAKVEREMATRGKEISESMRAQRATNTCITGDFTIRCHKCDSFAARLADIRTIENSHHVILDVHYRARIIIRPHPTPKKFENFELTGKIYCIKCHWDWGVMGVYKKVPFPIIKISSFVITDTYDNRQLYKRWKDVPYEVVPISPADLKNMMDSAVGRTVTEDDHLVDDDDDDDDDDEFEHVNNSYDFSSIAGY